MYRSKYHFKPAPKKHNALETIESTIHKNLQRLEPENPTLLVPYEVRNRHIYCVGRSGYGKSTLLNSIIQQDIENGAGVCVLDPKPSGMELNLVDTLLQHIPAHRRKDVIYFSAIKPIPIDAMSWKTEEDRQRLAADLMKLFMAFMTQKEGDRWPNILRFTIHTLLEAKGCTFLDIHDFLADRPSKSGKYKEILDRVHNPRLRHFWENFDLGYPKDATTPITSRMGQFVLVPPVSTMLGDPSPRFNLVQAILDRKIILIDLTGAGEDTMNLLGILMVSKIQQAIGRGLKVPFHLYADEFQNFQTSAFDKILSESRSLGLRITLANQYVDQLEDRIRSSIFGNVSTFIVLNIDEKDTRYFKSKMPPGLSYEVLAELPPYRALFSIADQPSIVKAIPRPPAPPTHEQLDAAEDMKASTLRDYGPDSCKTEPNQHPSKDGKQTPPDEKPQDDTRKAGGVGDTQPPFRPTQQRRGQTYPQKGAHQKRHPDSEPEPSPTEPPGPRPPDKIS